MALWSRLTGRPKPVSSWTREDRERADRVARNELAGVGLDDQMRTDDPPFASLALHVRKATTDAEKDSVFKTPRGRLIAARHERG